MYQDMLTSLAMRDERLSENIEVLSNSISNQRNKQDMNSSSTADIESLESKTKLIDNAQNLYEKKL
ncbi:hypothetical protein A3305_07620 (plasmid) [Rickettsia amblyommatis]|uniref:Uncharacterized protein n=2 Tax=Rickettsia amblyommatis TaxID=33989 RepID=H8K6B5_RICAG|nr:hypothetical protein [Rickettsia amblyommatis]AFC70426.1 hypothetical protein MCE_08535 [Rickettsia amblyommatis str. GAT-30V]ARD88223.1 hypothetical protein A3305_07620 [Rickettsia amblyommatis]